MRREVGNDKAVTPLGRFLAEKAAKTDRALEEFLEGWNDVPPILCEAVRHGLFSGGKRLRPALALGACEMVCGDDAPALPAACAIEMIHAYSLMHDDLPSMDDDDLRRGKPTTHKVYGEAMAILAGDVLLTMAFEMAAQSDNAGVVREIARAAGAEGMAGGQVMDLQSEGKRLALDELERLHARKTGALIRVSLRAGALLGGAADAHLETLTRYGEHIGLAFQIADDILDVVGDATVLGKRTGSDAAKEKSTYPALLGVDRARELADREAAAAVAALAAFGPEAVSFRDLARFMVERQR